MATADRSAAAPAAPLAVRMAQRARRLLVRAPVARGRRQGEALRLRLAVVGARGRRAAVEPPSRGRRARELGRRRARRADHRHERRRVASRRGVRERHVEPRARARRHARRQREPSRAPCSSRRCCRCSQTTRRERQRLSDGARRGLRGRRQSRPDGHGRRGLEDLPPDRARSGRSRPPPPARSCSAWTRSRRRTALALAANMAAGYNEWAGTGGSEMFFHNGLAARGAVTAVQLAAEGAYASRTALDGDAGHARGVPPAAPADGAGALRGSSRDPRRVLQARAGLQLRADAGASRRSRSRSGNASAPPTSTASACASRRPRPSIPAAT